MAATGCLGWLNPLKKINPGNLEELVVKAHTLSGIVAPIFHPLFIALYRKPMERSTCD